MPEQTRRRSSWRSWCRRRCLGLVSLVLLAGSLLSGCQDTANDSTTSQHAPLPTIPSETRTAVLIQDASTTPANDAAAQENRRRIVHAWDGCTMWATILNVDYYESPNREIPKPEAKFSRRILEEMIDEEAAANVDVISYCTVHRIHE